MIKLIDILKEINEAKQVGDVYHFTELYNVINLLKSGYILPNEENQVSTTRNASLYIHIFYLGDPNNIARLMLDGTKISSKYKIVPFAFNKTRNEYEEQIVTNGKPFQFLPYLKRIDLFVSNPEDEEVVKVKKVLQKSNIPYKIYTKDPSDIPSYGQDKSGNPKDINLNLSEDINNFNNWKLPDTSQLKQEFKIEHEIKGNDFWKDEDDFLNSVKNGKIVTITPSEDQDISYRSGTRSYEQLLNLIKSYRSYPKYRNEDTLKSIYDGFKTNQPMTLPIIIEFKDGNKRVFSGNTRMDIAFQLGINPKVLLIKSNTIYEDVY